MSSAEVVPSIPEAVLVVSLVDENGVVRTVDERWPASVDRRLASVVGLEAVAEEVAASVVSLTAEVTVVKAVAWVDDDRRVTAESVTPNSLNNVYFKNDGETNSKLFSLIL
jgi:hypothetical protein